MGGAAIVVSQFTLYADTRKGRRPSFTDAAPPEIASPLVERFADLLTSQGVPTQTGEFGAHMLVEIENDGPVTILAGALNPRVRFRNPAHQPNLDQQGYNSGYLYSLNFRWRI